MRFAWIEKRLLRNAIRISMIAAIVLPLVIVKYNRTHTRDVEVTALSVGHGQAVFIRMPSGANILFDAGSLGTKDPGSRIVTPFLRHRGINDIDSLILSHGDSDHMNGIPEIISSCSVGGVYANAAVLEKASTSSMAGYLSYCLKNMNYEIKLLDDTLTFKNGATIRSLWPDPNACDDPALSDNDKSQVVLVEFAGRKVLLTSDIELHGQEQLLERYPDLRADVLVMPHHGSKRNLVDGFAERLGAETVIISCSRTRRATAYEAPAGIKAFYTPVDGAITTKIKADGTISTVGFADNQ
jgi:competence protein ComEC